ncbi:hypothetical protein GS532_22315 [Rhodococcus hoagii]|nr:hypothetical protein [Prescottella equi]
MTTEDNSNPADQSTNDADVIVSYGAVALFSIDRSLIFTVSVAPAARTTMRVIRELPLVKSHRPRRSVNCVAPLTYTNRIPVPAVFCRWSIDTFVPVTFALSSWNTAAFEICVGAAVTMIPSTSRVPLLTTNVCAAARRW